MTTFHPSIVEALDEATSNPPKSVGITRYRHAGETETRLAYFCYSQTSRPDFPYKPLILVMHPSSSGWVPLSPSGAEWIEHLQSREEIPYV